MNLTPNDRIMIRELVERYAQLVDSRDFTRVGNLFAPDAELELPDPPTQLVPVRVVSGRHAITQELTRLEQFATTFHAVCGQTIDPGDTPDVASGIVNCVAHHAWADESGHRDLVWHLRYRDSYQRSESGWLLARRAIRIELIEKRPVNRINDVPLYGPNGTAMW